MVVLFTLLSQCQSILKQSARTADPFLLAGVFRAPPRDHLLFLDRSAVLLECMKSHAGGYGGLIGVDDSARSIRFLSLQKVGMLVA